MSDNAQQKGPAANNADQPPPPQDTAGETVGEAIRVPTLMKPPPRRSEAAADGKDAGKKKKVKRTPSSNTQQEKGPSGPKTPAVKRSNRTPSRDKKKPKADKRPSDPTGQPDQTESSDSTSQTSSKGVSGPTCKQKPSDAHQSQQRHGQARPYAQAAGDYSHDSYGNEPAGSLNLPQRPHSHGRSRERCSTLLTVLTTKSSSEAVTSMLPVVRTLHVAAQQAAFAFEQKQKPEGPSGPANGNNPTRPSGRVSLQQHRVASDTPPSHSHKSSAPDSANIGSQRSVEDKCHNSLSTRSHDSRHHGRKGRSSASRHHDSSGKEPSGSPQPFETRSHLRPRIQQLSAQQGQHSTVHSCTDGSSEPPAGAPDNFPSVLGHFCSTFQRHARVSSPPSHCRGATSSWERLQFVRMLDAINSPRPTHTDLSRFQRELVHICGRYYPTGADSMTDVWNGDSVMAKLPFAVRCTLIKRKRDQGDSSPWTLGNMLGQLDRVLAVLREADAYTPNTPQQPSGSRGTQRHLPAAKGTGASSSEQFSEAYMGAPQAGPKKRQCPFCRLKGKHWAVDCPHYANVSKRYARAIELSLCINCLGKDHQAPKACKAPHSGFCDVCGDAHHHKALCTTFMAKRRAGVLQMQTSRTHISSSTCALGGLPKISAGNFRIQLADDHEHGKQHSAEAKNRDHMVLQSVEARLDQEPSGSSHESVQRPCAQDAGTPLQLKASAEYQPVTAHLRCNDVASTEEPSGSLAPEGQHIASRCTTTDAQEPPFSDPLSSDTLEQSNSSPAAGMPIDKPAVENRTTSPSAAASNFEAITGLHVLVSSVSYAGADLQETTKAESCVAGQHGDTDHRVPPSALADHRNVADHLVLQHGRGKRPSAQEAGAPLQLKASGENHPHTAHRLHDGAVPPREPSGSLVPEQKRLSAVHVRVPSGSAEAASRVHVFVSTISIADFSTRQTRSAATRATDQRDDTDHMVLTSSTDVLPANKNLPSEEAVLEPSGSPALHINERVDMDEPSGSPALQIDENTDMGEPSGSLPLNIDEDADLVEPSGTNQPYKAAYVQHWAATAQVTHKEPSDKLREFYNRPFNTTDGRKPHRYDYVAEEPPKPHTEPSFENFLKKSAIDAKARKVKPAEYSVKVSSKSAEYSAKPSNEDRHQTGKSPSRPSTTDTTSDLSDASLPFKLPTIEPAGAELVMRLFEKYRSKFDLSTPERAELSDHLVAKVNELNDDFEGDFAQQYLASLGIIQRFVSSDTAKKRDGDNPSSLTERLQLSDFMSHPSTSNQESNQESSDTIDQVAANVTEYQSIATSTIEDEDGSLDESDEESQRTVNDEEQSQEDDLF